MRYPILLQIATCLISLRSTIAIPVSDPSLLKREELESEVPVISINQIVEDTTYIFPQEDYTNPFPMPSCQGITLEEATIDQLQDYMSQGLITSYQITQCYFERYLQLNPYLSSIIEINPDMFTIAKSLDEERQSGIVRGPLHGIPFVVKDNYGTKDRMNTCAGSPMLLGSIVPRDAHVVKKLRDAGAVLFGHSSMSEWADMRSSWYSEGYSPLGGQSRNPFNLTINGGGSSTGSAGSVSANMIMFALGTETDGSIVDPAARQGVVGFKPTVGLTSRDMVIPESHNQDSTGPHARTVRDATYVLQYMYGVDPNDNYTLAQVGKTPEDGDYVKYLTDKSSLKGAKFGLPWEGIWTLGNEEEMDELFYVLQMLEDAGAEIINNTNFKDPSASISPDGWDWAYGDTRGYVNESEFTVVKTDFYHDIAKYLSQLSNTEIRSLEDIVNYNLDNVGTEGGEPDVHPAFESGQDSFLASLEWGGEMNETYYQALEYVHRTTRDEGIDYALNYTDPVTNENYQLDGLLVPTSASVSYQQAAMAGYPYLTIPVGVRNSTGRPFGLGIMQTAFAETQLIKYGSAIEDLINGREMPMFYDYMSKVLPVL